MTVSTRNSIREIRSMNCSRIKVRIASTIKKQQRFQFHAAFVVVLSRRLYSQASRATVFSTMQFAPSHLYQCFHEVDLFQGSSNSMKLMSSFFFSEIRLDWEAYNILPQDNQLLDMLVFIGQPLPVIKDGQEAVPSVQEENCYRCEGKPFIQVKLREHEGARANRPFEVTPSQQVWRTVL